MFKFTRFCVQQTTYGLFAQTKRCKGHSKWQNIRHTKGVMDAERASLYMQYAKRMKVAIAEGKSADPHINMKLAQIIDEAKKKSVPQGTINGVIEKLTTSKLKMQSDIVDFRGPGHSQFVLRILSENVAGFKIILNSILKKHSSVANDGKSLTAFHHQGFILTEMEVDLDTATNDAITTGAEDVEEVEEDKKLLKFMCHPSSIAKVTNQLKNLNYKIITSDEDFMPKATIALDENNMEKIDALCQKLNRLEEVVSIYHNIEMPEPEEKEMTIDAQR